MSSLSRNFLCVCLLLPRLISADTIVLKNGERLEGKITSETDTQVTIESREGGVVEERSVSRSDIVKLDKEPPQEVDFKPLKGLKPGPNFIRPEDYDVQIAKLKSYLQRYPLSSHVAEVEQSLKAFEDERSRVVGGEVKFHDKWLSNDQAAAQREDILASSYFDAMKEQVARGNVIGALNTFDVLEKKFSGAQVYPDAVELALSLITPLEVSIERNLKTLQTEYDNLKANWKTMTLQQRQDMDIALKRESAQLEAQLAAAEAQRLKWPPFQPRHKQSLEKLKNVITSEKNRLRSIPVDNMRSAIERTRIAATELAERDVNGAEKDIKQALFYWPQYSYALKVDADIVAKKAEMAKATPAPSPSPTSPAKATPKPAAAATPTPKPKKPWWQFGS